MENRQRVFIRGIEGRGDEVIAALVNLGGKNDMLKGGNNPSSIYFITHDGYISFIGVGSETAKILEDYYKEIKLPEQKWKDGDILFNDTRQEFAVFENECLFNTDKVASYFVTNCGKCLTNESICKRDFRLATKAEIALFYKYLHNNGKDWDTKKKRLVKLRWKPKIKEIYWFINNLDGHLGYAPFTNDTFDNDNYNLGNCFKTKEEAEIAAKKIKKSLKGEQL